MQSINKILKLLCSRGSLFSMTEHKIIFNKRFTNAFLIFNKKKEWIKILVNKSLNRNELRTLNSNWKISFVRNIHLKLTEINNQEAKKPIKLIDTILYSFFIFLSILILFNFQLEPNFHCESKQKKNCTWMW